MSHNGMHMHIPEPVGKAHTYLKRSVYHTLRFKYGISLYYNRGR